MDDPAPPARQRRNKSFDATHQALIEAAVRLISEKGVEALSVAALARAVKMNRATVYYHFTSREALLEAVQAWSSAQLVKGFEAPASQSDRIDFVARFVLANPDLIKLWIEQFIAPGDIRERYPRWDDLVTATAQVQAARAPAEPVDVEVYCAFLLAGAIIGPRVFRHSIRPEASAEEVVARFRAEQQRMLRRDGLLRE
ncbi:TetR/AcrR family transcriptional regulator [Novosphingobium piscinae]|uniref:TetR/AcrR family transcriptional regulator n=1 Tax=Novosphingobium piscinae TaxID=1507448 RepID=A0A7X1FVC4_9SPHN|nr:TetR/AcrR family transcriptional regulator [Novosphingobium piscinae]MBC2667524.1 TetR/AcrR family transcriptional regulator [Novosphingobium piscinae]